MALEVVLGKVIAFCLILFCWYLFLGTIIFSCNLLGRIKDMVEWNKNDEDF